MPRNRIDKALNTSGRGPWIATGVVFLLGVLVLAWVISPTERKRRAIVEDLELGDDSLQVLTALGTPVRCPPRSADVIRGGFPGDWPAPAIESALERMQEETAQRWIYAINPRKRLPCSTEKAHTEIGIGKDGRVLWYIPVTGRTSIELPEDYTPSSAAS